MDADDTPRRPGPVAVTCDVGNLPCDTRVVDAMARLRLRARRLGIDLRYRDPCDDLRALVELVGLGEVLIESDLVAERKAEQREETLRVEEEGDP
jgi:hypothetical protein